MKLLLLVALLGCLCLDLLAAQYCDPNQPKTPCSGKDESECMENGCCWSATTGEPSCFFQTPKYIVKSVSNTTNGQKLTLAIEEEEKSLPGSPISPLSVEFILETSNRLHVKITDPNSNRWEIPDSVLPLPPPPPKPITYPNYAYNLPDVGSEFFFSVFRNYYNTSIFNTSSIPLFFGNQFLKIGTKLKPNYNIYGLGEHKTSLRLKAGQTYTLWNYDTPTPENLNLYGSHPFYLEVMEDGSTHGVFLRNSNGMDIELTDTSLTYKVLGGVLDFYFFLGYGPEDVIQNYHSLIGRPAMPPYWALGFHQCRWGYNNLQQVKEVVVMYYEYKIPLETMWTDIDYMDQYKDFTTDPANFPTATMKEFIEDLHSKGQHYVVIVDPAISTTQGYKPYVDGQAQDIFVKDRDSKVFVGKVWPGFTAYPDFMRPETSGFWREQIASFLKQVPVDGIWLDMNEPSNFCNGACNENRTSRAWNGSASMNYVSPPYSINNQGNKLPLNSKTLDMDAMHYSGPEYNVHNLYGLTESKATYQALMSLRPGTRPFVLSRSTFPGSGSYTAHWLGDNAATEEDIYYSIPGILNFQLFGVPLVGADICGFDGITSEELCGRWMQLGAFYPFSRNHNSKLSPPQEPYNWPSVAAISIKYLTIRYSILPYYYTLFFRAAADPTKYRDLFYPSSSMVLKPLFVPFPLDKECLSIDSQFLVGDALLISPQLKLGTDGKTLRMYVPPGQWYDWYTLEEVLTTPGYMTVDTPFDYMPIHIRGGYIIPMQEPGLTTNDSRKNPYSLLVALEGGGAEGQLYLDDGVTYNTSQYTYVSYSCRTGELTSYVSGTNYATKMKLPSLQSVTVVGLEGVPSLVALEGQLVPFNFTAGRTFKLVVSNLNINMDTEFSLTWM